MNLRIKQRQYSFGSPNGWKGELAGTLVAALLLCSVGFGLLGWGILGEPKAKPGRESAVPVRVMVLFLGLVSAPLGLHLGHQAFNVWRHRHEVDENEYTLPDVTSYELLSDAEVEAVRMETKKRKPWITY